MLRKFVQFLVLAVAVMFVVSTLAVAAEMTCSKVDDKGNCTMAKDAMGKESAVMGKAGMGDKMDCMSKDGKMECKGMMMKK